MKKTVAGAMSLLFIIAVVLLGCSQRSGSGLNNPETNNSRSNPAGPFEGSGKIRLTVYSTIAEPPNQALMKSIAADFTKENPDISVEFQFPGADYENILKVKMAANDLPDVFDTHGWAISRYGKYLADLEGESWAARMTDSIKPVVTGKDGKVYALVVSEAKDGISYNAEILAKYGITPPSTFNELMAAAGKIKTQSKGDVIPFFMSGVDNGMIGEPFDLFSTSLFISPKKNDTQSLLAGTFDWNKWTTLAQRMQDMFTKGYINKDVLTAKYTDLPALFAKGKVAFVFGAPSFADEVYKYNKDAAIGIMPVTSMVDGDAPTFSGGERYTMGAWKDGKHLDASKKLIAFFARTENMTRIANATKLPAGLKDIPSQHEFSSYYEKFANIHVYPYFDRLYLPNGMWDVICKTGAALLAGIVSPEQFSMKMKEEYQRLQD